MYRGEKKVRPNLGIKPTQADHDFVHTLSLMGEGVRHICERLGERYKLGKPMARSTMYWHFRQDLVTKVRGRKAGKATLKRRIEHGLHAEMQRLIDSLRKAKDG